MATMRLLRVPLPAALIDEVDELVDEGAGGLRTRDQFIREALEAMVLELRYGRDLEVGTPKGSDAEPVGAATTALPTPRQPAALSEWVDVPAAHEPLFGLHNRDYPSIWAASRLCDLTAEGPVSFEPALRDLVGSAWTTGEQLSQLDATLSGKPSALFPTNRDKQQSAENAFLSFAVGTVSRREGTWHTSGPLFAWGILRIDDPHSAEPRVSVTDVGYALLVDMAGMTVEQPHPEDLATRFISHLREYAPADWDGLATALEAAQAQSSRTDLVDFFAERWPKWSPTEAATNAAGYVARGREWGLIAAKQVDGRYAITDFGSRMLAEEAA